MTFWSVVGADLNVYYRRGVTDRSFGGRLRAFLRAYLDTDFRVVFQFRLFQRLTRSRLKPLGLMLYYRQKSRYCVDLSPWATIGPGLRIQHPFNVVIGPDAKVGANCMIFNGVTLGNARPDIIASRMPVIGDDCILGTGAKIFGTIRVDDGIIVGANLVVKQDVVRGGEYLRMLEAEGRARVRHPPTNRCVEAA